MRLSNSVSPQIIAGATGLLQPFCPELSPQTLVAALTDYQEKTEPIMEKALTMAQAAQMLQVSSMTIFRMLKAGKLPKWIVGKRSVRIPASAIYACLAPAIGQPKTTKEGK